MNNLYLLILTNIHYIYHHNNNTNVFSLKESPKLNQPKRQKYQLVISISPNNIIPEAFIICDIMANLRDYNSECVSFTGLLVFFRISLGKRWS